MRTLAHLAVVFTALATLSGAIADNRAVCSDELSDASAADPCGGDDDRSAAAPHACTICLCQLPSTAPAPRAEASLPLFVGRQVFAPEHRSALSADSPAPPTPPPNAALA